MRNVVRRSQETEELMAHRPRPTLQKRERERARLQKRQDKTARREAAKTRRTSTSHRSGVDPDIAHIRPGPQPPAEWQVEDAEE